MGGLADAVATWMAAANIERAAALGNSFGCVTFRDSRDAGFRRLLVTAHRCLRHRMEERLPLVRMPVLVVRGERDPIVPQRWGEEVVALLPDGRLAVMPDAAHTLTDNRPEQLAEIVLPFL